MGSRQMFVLMTTLFASTLALPQFYYSNVDAERAKQAYIRQLEEEVARGNAAVEAIQLEERLEDSILREARDSVARDSGDPERAARDLEHLGQEWRRDRRAVDFISGLLGSSSGGGGGSGGGSSAGGSDSGSILNLVGPLLGSSSGSSSGGGGGSGGDGQSAGGSDSGSILNLVGPLLGSSSGGSSGGNSGGDGGEAGEGGEAGGQASAGGSDSGSILNLVGPLLGSSSGGSGGEGGDAGSGSGSILALVGPLLGSSSGSSGGGGGDGNSGGGGGSDLSSILGISNSSGGSSSGGDASAGGGGGGSGGLGGAVNEVKVGFLQDKIQLLLRLKFGIFTKLLNSISGALAAASSPQHVPIDQLKYPDP